MLDNHIRGGVEAGRLESFHEEEVLTLDLVSAFAGDRALTESETVLLDNLKKGRGEGFYPDLLYAITHESFTASVAEELWNEIIRHKGKLSEAVGRNVGVAVAALDYLSNLKGELKSPTLIGESQVADIARLALRDGLTRLFNHATCVEKIAVELRIYERYGRPASLLMIDVDDFKQVNDEYGHQAGDRVLAALGATIDAATRGSDICCRYGGEEFVIIMPSTGGKEASLLAERLRTTAEESRPDGRRVTISVGVASCGQDTRSAHAFLQKVDAAMYRAKRGGKNRVVVSS
jgi:diguanylate cyclase (GGDEF)-like protein